MDTTTSSPTKHFARFQELVDAANANESVKEFRAAREWWSDCWNEESIARRPPLRVEFEHAVAFATLSEGISLRRSKSGWGAFLAIAPLRPDNRLHPTRTVYQLKASSKMRQRWETRDTYKRILGKHRGLVNDAVSQSKKEFLQGLNAFQKGIIWELSGTSL